MSHPAPVTIDFETLGIQKRPLYPPCPVGVSIKYPGKPAKYYGWGHPTGNNCTWAQGYKALSKAWKHHDGLLFQNGKFDVDVATTHMGVEMPNWRRIHDTMFLLFLDSPHENSLSLKPSAERLLDMPPEEQDAVGEWLIENQPITGIKITRGKGGQHYFGRYLAYAPGSLVGVYADGDVIRTEKLFNLLYAKIVEQNMVPAYDRERELMPCLLDMERQGLPVDHKKLDSDVKKYATWLETIDSWIYKRIKCEINLNSGEQLVEAMVASGRADPELIPLTPTGKYQTNKDALLLGVTDKTLLAVLKYRTQLNTCMSTFMKPWLEIADMSGGLIYTTWNQIKSALGGGSVGTKSGRLSSTPNFQNIPNDFQPIFAHEQKGLAKCPWKDLPHLPSVRQYIVPFPGHMFIDRDYSQQEPRILADFDGDALLEQYLENPWLDFHDNAQEKLAERGKIYDRKPVKNTNLGLIYGMGVGTLAERNDMEVIEAKSLKNAILEMYPGLKEMYKEMKRRAKAGEPIRTWGGRVYYCEEPKLVRGRLMHFDYKMVNILIQGSGADCTKEAIIRFYKFKQPDWKLVLNVHDQLTVSIEPRWLGRAMPTLKKAMEELDFDVPMLTEGAVSRTNWGELIDYDKKGVML